MANLLVTVGDSPLPVVLTIMGLRPEHVAFVVDDTVGPHLTPQDTVELVLKCVASLGHEVVNHHVANVPRYDPEAIGMAADRLMDARPGVWHVGYTAGSPTMAMAILQRWTARQSAAADARRPSETEAPPNAWYVDGETLIGQDGAVVTIAPRDAPTLTTIAGLHGWALAAADWVKRSDSPSERASQVRAAKSVLERLPVAIPARTRESANDALKRASLALIRDALPSEYELFAPVILTRAGRQVPLDAVATRGLAATLFGFSGYISDGRRMNCAHIGGFLEQRKEDAFALNLLAKVVGGLTAISVFVVYPHSAGPQAGCRPRRGIDARGIVSAISDDIAGEDFPRQSQLILHSESLANELGLRAWLEAQG